MTFSSYFSHHLLLLLIHIQDIPNGAGQTPLFEACSRGREDVALYLIEQGANIEKANPKRACPLLMAAESGSDVVVKALIAKGADKNQANQWSQTPLFTAVQRNHPRVVKTLVECGADVNRFDYKGYTPLAVAVERGFVDIAVYLMREGKADLRARTNDLITKQGRRVVARGPGDLPIDLAKKCNRPEAMKQAILDEEEYRKSGKSGKIRADGETTEPAAKKQRLSEKQQSEEAGDISTID